jgi:predicted nucleic acid-binding protein
VTLWVVDASVILKWYVPEGDYAAARAMQTTETKLAAPDLLFIEMSNILWKLVRRGEMAAPRAVEIIEEVTASPFITFSTQSLVRDALDLGIATGLTAYDASYVALAIRLDKILITADQKLVRKVMLSGTRNANHVRLLANPTN